MNSATVLDIWPSDKILSLAGLNNRLLAGMGELFPQLILSQKSSKVQIYEKNTK
jgi:hypothetical protein